MKTKQIIALLIALCPLAGIAQTLNFTIEGKLNSQYNGKQIKLYYSPDESKKILDSTTVNKGAFKFTGKLERPLSAKLAFGKEDAVDGIDVFLADGLVQVTAKDSLRYAKITGGALVSDYEELAKTLRPLDNKILSAMVYYRDMPEGEAKKAYIAKLMGGFDQYRSKKREAIHQFALQHPDSYISLYYLDKNSPKTLLNYKETFPYYSKLSSKIKETPLGKQLSTRLEAVKGKLTGEQFTDFVSTTPEGTALSLKEVAAKHKYTLVDFWASWCGPCRKENPNVVKTFNAFKDKGFTVLSVSLDDNADKWKAAIKSDGMPWYHVSSLKGWKEPAAMLYNIRAIPQNILVDAQGRIVATNLREETLFNKVQSLLN